MTALPQPSLRTILVPKWRSALNRLRQERSGGSGKFMLLALVALGFWAAVFGVSFRVLRYIQQTSEVGVPLASKLLSIILLSFASLLLLSNLITALSSFFLAKDLDLLVSSPADWLRPLIDDASRYRRILPLGDDIPFWQRPLVMQPNFLRAAVMERDRSWAELESLALDWSRADAGDPEPWYFKGIALTQLNQLGAARQALEQVVAIEPASSAAWFRLGLL